MTRSFANPAAVMAHALDLALGGRGYVEPNPCVGAVVVDDALRCLGEGYHQRFGGPHAEIHALRQAGDRCRGATLFVTLEPCCHVGQTPPCSQAVIDAGLKRVVVATRDPFPQVNGGGIRDLRNAGIDVEVGLLEPAARELIAPFLTRLTQQRPYVHAKWAMTLDGKIAAHTGASKWISNPTSRKLVHELRGRMDAIVIGHGTARTDNPLLTVRPPGPRIPARVVFDSQCRLSPHSQLVQTVDQAPVVVLCSSSDSDNARALTTRGVEVIQLAADDEPALKPEVHKALRILADRQMTNILVEGGGTLLGAFFDAGAIDECHVFIAPKLVGGTQSVTPMGGHGLNQIPSEPQFRHVRHSIIGDNFYIHATCGQTR